MERWRAEQCKEAKGAGGVLILGDAPGLRDGVEVDGVVWFVWGRQLPHRKRLAGTDVRAARGQAWSVRTPITCIAPDHVI
jgi:hypothetical protein